jgi:predicted helicase
MTFKDILTRFRKEAFTEKDKGTRFERLMRLWLLSDPRFNQLTDVWLWEDFPGRRDFGGADVGIDLVAKTEMGEYWAVQCKCYGEHTTIDKPAVDSFLATSSRTFTDEVNLRTTRFAHRLWISTTAHWGSNAEEALQNQDPAVSRIGLADLMDSPVDWEKLLQGLQGAEALREGKKPMKHQLEAITQARRHYIERGETRGKLIMACGTGKTYTSLLTVESLLEGGRGLVLFMVPSIALLGQSLNAWAADAKRPLKAICICSDAKASRRVGRATAPEDDVDDSPVDLALPASTHPEQIRRQLMRYRNYDGLVVVFSTYQSVDAVMAAQQAVLGATGGAYGTFDFIVCDEAHRTTGVKLSNRDESNFTKIHSDANVAGRRRLYMTATPRLYGDAAKVKAAEKDCVLCSMDDTSLYGEEYYRVNFSYAVQNGLLTDYKVLVLTVSEEDIPENIRQDITSKTTEYDFDDTSKLIGVINGLSKLINGDDGRTWQADPRMMRRAVAFCPAIGNEGKKGTSKYIASLLPRLSQRYDENVPEAEKDRVVRVESRHIDGSMNTQERAEILQWLSEETDDRRACRVVTNVRCLSEGVDVPSLDAVLFLSPRNSQVDVVQSVGRVMRTFHRGQSDEKRYGYIIIPIVVPANVPAEEALNNNRSFDVVWSILNALRSHDDRFNAMVNKIALNKQKPTQQSSTPSVLMGQPGLRVQSAQDDRDAQELDRAEIARQLEMRFGELSDGMYAKLVEKCGDRLYWENWSKEVGLIAQKFIERIGRLIQSGAHREEFEKYLKSLQRDLNPSVDRGQAIEMLAQHMITRPVFDALFADYRFVDNNTVSRSMQRMIELLQEEAFEKDTEVLQRFYDSVRMNVGDIDNLEGKQTIIKNLYEKFFKGAFPLTVEKLGIVYTPVECVDFIIHSVNDLLQQEFHKTLSDEHVHILDPFTGTGTFVTRLLQSGLIRPEDMERKYLQEIHCNEIVLLAYYIADVNIESVYHDLMHPDHYVNYDGICLTDTFQLSEPSHNLNFTEFFQENNERVEKLKHTPVRVIIGNPPYSVGQKSANDNAQNLSYPVTDARLARTYVAKTQATNKNALYDSYIRAFRWASDCIPDEEGGVVAFISNGAWLDGNTHDGMRRCLEHEFSSIYVLNLRGNARTSGEMRRREGDGVFGEGSRTPIAITFLVKNPAKKGQTAQIYYHDIGDYLSREDKLKKVRTFGSIRKVDWQIITPNDKADWINQRDGVFDSLIPMFPEKKESMNSHSFFVTYSRGLATARDSWCYNSSSTSLESNLRMSIDFYNEQRKKLTKGEISDVVRDATKFSWARGQMNDVRKNTAYDFENGFCYVGLYRPFFKQHGYFSKEMNDMTYKLPTLFPTPDAENLVICVHGIGGSKDFSCLITDSIPDLQVLFNGQCFPYYFYNKKIKQEGTLFDGYGDDGYERHEALTGWILDAVRQRYRGAKNITKEHIFYYVYGLLHSPEYRERFADDLKKSLPRLPIVDRVEDFMALARAGRDLAALHLRYEQVPPAPEVSVRDSAELGSDEYAHYAVEKMSFAKVRDAAGKLQPDKSRIVLNSHITVEGIPARAYDYVVNGKSAIEWLMERYAVTVDKDSLIKNDPNDWAREQHRPRYILDLLLSVINVSLQTMAIVDGLPHISVAPTSVSEDTPAIVIPYASTLEKDEEHRMVAEEKDK